jgi:hypothetical protein
VLSIGLLAGLPENDLLLCNSLSLWSSVTHTYPTATHLSGYFTPIKEFNMAVQRRSKHTKKQKETARKRCPSYLRKGVELGQKANIVAGGFYEEPTHRHWCLSCHVPEGRDLPDLQAIVRQETLQVLMMLSF